MKNNLFAIGSLVFFLLIGAMTIKSLGKVPEVKIDDEEIVKYLVRNEDRIQPFLVNRTRLSLKPVKITGSHINEIVIDVPRVDSITLTCNSAWWWFRDDRIIDCSKASDSIVQKIICSKLPSPKNK